jgi:mRNA-degrading endonuclease toxin of MazEF toxin-antitoxin module
MNVGEIYWVEFPAGAGRAQAGRRPAIVVQKAIASAQLPTVLLIPLTTQLESLRFPGTVLIEVTEENGLRRPSVALVFQLTAVDRRFLGAQLGRISSDVLQAIWSVLDTLMGRTNTDSSSAMEE